MPRISLKPLRAKKTSMKPSIVAPVRDQNETMDQSGKRLEQCFFESVG
jgi:hypothetical protein